MLALLSCLSATALSLARQHAHARTTQRAPNILMPLALLAGMCAATQGSERPVSNLAVAGRTCVCGAACSGASESAEQILEGHV
jgi:hypothetical protein